MIPGQKNRKNLPNNSRYLSYYIIKSTLPELSIVMHTKNRERPRHGAALCFYAFIGFRCFSFYQARLCIQEHSNPDP